jgi:mannose PTS system EIIA component
MNSILIIAHSPFAQALRKCALHVFPDSENAIVALDVLPNVPPEETLAAARITLAQQLHGPRVQVLVLADVFGAWRASIFRCCCAP